MQFNPSYGTYLLYDDGGPAKNVKMKKYRGGEKEKLRQDDDKQEFSAATSAMTNAPKKSRRKRGSTARLDEGQLWGHFADCPPRLIQLPLVLMPILCLASEETEGHEDGAKWYGGEDRPNVIHRLMARGQDLAELGQNTGQQLVAWIPGITEQERNQAELLDSDSDAAVGLCAWEFAEDSWPMGQACGNLIILS
jgi:hypothetical protein